MFTVYAKIQNAWVYQGGFDVASDAIECARWLREQGVKEINIDDGLTVEKDSPYAD